MDFSLEEEDRVFAIEVSTAIFLFNRARGHGSGCTTAPSGMQYLAHVFLFPSILIWSCILFDRENTCLVLLIVHSSLIVLNQLTLIQGRV